MLQVLRDQHLPSAKVRGERQPDSPDGLLPIVIEDHFSEETRRRIVHVNDDMLHACHSLECPLDEVRSCGSQDLWNQPLDPPLKEPTAL